MPRRSLLSDLLWSLVVGRACMVAAPATFDRPPLHPLSLHLPAPLLSPTTTAAATPRSIFLFPIYPTTLLPRLDPDTTRSLSFSTHRQHRSLPASRPPPFVGARCQLTFGCTLHRLRSTPPSSPPPASPSASPSHPLRRAICVTLDLVPCEIQPPLRPEQHFSASQLAKTSRCGSPSG